MGSVGAFSTPMGKYTENDVPHERGTLISLKSQYHSKL
jgi:hypothetical protein